MRPRGGDGMGGTDGSPRLGAVGYSAPAVSGEPRIADRFGRRRALPARWPGGQIWLHRGEGRPSLSPRRQALPLLGREHDRLGGRLRGDPVTPDRKSVVQGKSVSVRVDLGGRRYIRKKTKNLHYNKIKTNTP